MGVYSGVYEYTQQIRNKYQVYRVYVYLGHLLSCRQDPCSTIGFFLGVKRIGRRLLYGSGFRAAQRSSAWSLALQLAGASMQNATDRTGEGSEHPSTENDSCKSLSEPVSPSCYNPETMAGECQSGMVYVIKDQKVLPMIVIGLER